MNISSNTVIVATDAETLFAFLEEMRNYERLMPERITDWEATSSQCHFAIPGMTEIGMQIKNISRFSLVQIESYGKVPFSFQLDFHITDTGKGQQVSIEFDADMPAMISMMAKGPLQNLINHMVTQLQASFS